MATSLLLCLSLTAMGTRPITVVMPEKRIFILGPVLQAVQAQLSDLPVKLKIERVAQWENGGLAAQMRAVPKFATEDAVAVIWFDLSPGDPIFIYVADPHKGRVLVRSVDWDGALGHLEAVAVVVRSSIQALLYGQNIGFEAYTPPGTLAQQSSYQENKPTPFQFSLRLGYAPSVIADNLPVLHGLGIAATFEWKNRFYAGLEYRLVDSFIKKKSQYVMVVVHRHPFSVVVGGRRRTGRWELSGELALSAHLVNMDIREVIHWPSLPPPQNQYLYSVGPSVMGRVLLLKSWSAFVGLGTDIAIGEKRYLIDGQSGGVLLDPWRFQWRGLAGFQWDLF